MQTYSLCKACNRNCKIRTNEIVLNCDKFIYKENLKIDNQTKIIGV